MSCSGGVWVYFLEFGAWLVSVLIVCVRCDLGEKTCFLGRLSPLRDFV